MRSEPIPLEGASPQLPLFGSPMPTGFASPAEDAFEQDIDLNALLISNPPATYLLKMASEAMVPTIHPDDFLVVDRSLPVQPGRIVVMAVEGEYLVRYFAREPDRIILSAEHPAFSPLVITSEMEATHFGVVRWVLHRTNQTKRRARR